MATRTGFFEELTPISSPDPRHATGRTSDTATAILLVHASDTSSGRGETAFIVGETNTYTNAHSWFALQTTPGKGRTVEQLRISAHGVLVQYDTEE